MKKLAFFSLLLSLNFAVAQNSEMRVKYYINQNPKFCKKHEPNVYFKSKDSVVVHKVGTTVEEKIGGKTYQKVLKKDVLDTIMEYEKKDLNQRWIAGEIKYSDDDPGRLFLNPWPDKSKKIESTTPFDYKAYISVPTNSKVTLRKTFLRIEPITVPFGVRFRINDSIGEQATADLNLGLSLSYNNNWEVFRNRRIKKLQAAYGLSLGGGIGLSRISLNSSNTNLSHLRLEEGDEESGLALSLSIGLGVNVRGLHFVCFLASDRAITDNVRLWNYYKRPYLGLGLGVNLSTLGKLVS